jgi:hypothetical protein
MVNIVTGLPARMLVSADTAQLLCASGGFAPKYAGIFCLARARAPMRRSGAHLKTSH